MASFQDFEGEFDADEYVERLASTVEGGGIKGGPKAFDPKKLSQVFEKTIRDLRALDEQMQGRINKLEELCITEQEEHRRKAREMEKTYKTASGLFQELDDRINYVATKVVHLGDQLEGINTPRSRAIEAQELMNYFEEFASLREPSSTVFRNPLQIHERASILQKLSLIAQELPADKFEDIRNKITEYHDQVEIDLIEEFKEAYIQGNIVKMKNCATTLLPFKGYTQCIDSFIEQSQQGQFNSSDVFKDVLPLCEVVHMMVKNVFGNNAEVVMGRLVQNIHEGVLKDHVKSQLPEFGGDKEQSLTNLYKLYGRAKALSEKLSVFKLGSDSNYLGRLRKNLFSEYLSQYIKTELEFLTEKSTMILEKHTRSIERQKRERPTASVLLPQKLQERIPMRVQQQLGTVPEPSSVDAWLSQDVAVSLLQENKNALKRCELLSSRSDVASNANKIYQNLLEHLCTEHIDHALAMAIQGLPPAEPRYPPELVFFDIVNEANAIFHLLEKHFTDCIIGLVGSSPVYSECVRKKKEVMEILEAKLEQGLERILTSLVGWTRFLLSTEQKKTDFRPEEGGGGMERTQACAKTCESISSQLQVIRESLDGKNLEAVLTEFGTQFHRVLFDHLQQFSYSYAGGMVAICDISEYRVCVKEFKIPLVVSLFEALYALTNLLVVAPDNLKQVFSGEQLAMLDKSVLQQFVQLRADYKTSKLARHFF